jgi:hypothetical protein
MKYRLLPIAVLALSVLGPRAHAAYVTGMSCHDVGGFARVVVQQKQKGVDLDEALDGLEDSLGPKFAAMKRSLALVVLMIYTRKPMSAAGPDEAGAAFEKACNRFEGRGR